jgi:hypothetical protein
MAFTKGPSQNPQTPAQAARTPASAAKTTSTKTVPPQPMLQPGETNAEHLERVRQWAADNNIKSPVQQAQEIDAAALKQDKERSKTK